MTTAFLPTGSTQPPPIGRIEDGRIDADNLFTSDTEFLAEAESAPDQFALGRLCQEAFELGVSVWRYARSTSEMLTVRDHLQGFEKGVEEATTMAVAALRDELATMVDPDQGAIAAAVSREMVKLSQTVEAAFDQNDKTSALSRIEESVEEITTEMVHEATKRVSALLNPNHDDSPLGALRSQIVREVSAPLTELSSSLNAVHSWIQIQKAVKEADEKGTAKGRSYEESVGSALVDIAGMDECEATGDQTGALGDSKVGDFVVTVSSVAGQRARVVFECKDQKLSQRALREELDRAVDNRQAVVGVAVISSDANAPNQAPLSTLAPRRYSVVYDKNSMDDLALKVAYHLARTDALTSARDDQNDAVDLERLAQKVAEARAILSQVTQVRRGLGKARGGLDTAENALSGLKDALSSVLEAISAELSKV